MALANAISSASPFRRSQGSTSCNRPTRPKIRSLSTAERAACRKIADAAKSPAYSQAERNGERLHRSNAWQTSQTDRNQDVLVSRISYFTTTMTSRFFEGRLLLFDLRGGIATDATYSFTVRRTSKSRSALDFAGRGTLIILRVIPSLLKRITSRKSGGSARNRQGRPFRLR